MNQVELRQLAEERILDAQALAAGQRWSLAYYTAGYAVECALKACVLSRMGITGWVFSEPKVKIDDVLTHNFEKLIGIAGLRDELNNRLVASTARGDAFTSYWVIVMRWDVSSRYAQTSEADARDLHQAIADTNDGILPW